MSKRSENRRARRATGAAQAAAKPAIPLPTGMPSGPIRVAAQPRRVERTLAELGTVPEHVTRYVESLSRISGERADSLLDGLIGTAPGNGIGMGGGWQNRVTGMGTRRDKVMHGEYTEPTRIDDPTLAALWNGNDIAKRIVGARAKEMFRRGWVLNLPGAPASRQNPGGQIGIAPATTPPPSPVSANDNASSGKPPVPSPLPSEGKDPQPDTGKAGASSPGSGAPPQTPRPPTSREKQPAAPLPREKKNRTDSIDPPALDRPDVNGRPAGTTPPDPHEGQGEEGPAAPGPQAAPLEPDPKTPPPGDQNSNADIASATEKYVGRLNYIPKLRESTIFGNLFGGGILIMGVDDGKAMSEPVDEANIKSVRFLTWIDRRFVVAHSYYEMIGPQYGDIEIYNVINPFGNQSNQYIHETRVLRFEGEPVDLLMRRRLAGWTLSKLQAPLDTMRLFDTSQQSIGNLMSDLSQAVMSIEGLAQMISSDPQTLQTRMAMVDMSRGSGRMIYLDAENEKFERAATPLTGVADVINMQMLRLAAAAEMPVALLFGREPSGLNATGDADFRRFYDMVAGDQRELLEPKLQRLFRLCFLAKDGPTAGQLPPGEVTFTFHKLYEPSELEQSTVRWNMAQADDKYIANGTLLPEEVAMSRFRSGDLHLDTEIQGDLRREKLASAQLAPSGAEKFQADQEMKSKELEVKARAASSKEAPPGAGARPAD